MVHTDHAPTGHHAREVHHAGTRRAHRSTRLPGDVDAAVARQPRPGWRVESSDHDRRPVERPPEPPAGRHTGGRNRSGGRARATSRARATNGARGTSRARRSSHGNSGPTGRSGNRGSAGEDTGTEDHDDYANNGTEP
jgi:hypothetical protein